MENRSMCCAEQQEPTILSTYRRICNDQAVVEDILTQCAVKCVLWFIKDQVYVRYLTPNEGQSDALPKSITAKIDLAGLCNLSFPLDATFDGVYRNLLALEHDYLMDTDVDFLSAKTKMYYDFQLLNTIVLAMENGIDRNSNLLEHASMHVQLDAFRPIYGQKNNVHAYTSMAHYAYKGNMVSDDFLSYLQYNTNAEYAYLCHNLYQICGALLDYMINYMPFSKTTSGRWYLRCCKRCGRYFLADNRKTLYCHYWDPTGNMYCSDLVEKKRKENYTRPQITPEEDLAKRIGNRLLNYVRSAENASYCNEETINQRKKLYNLFIQQKSIHAGTPNYLQWLEEAAYHLPSKKGESYDKLYQWMQGKE